MIYELSLTAYLADTAIVTFTFVRIFAGWFAISLPRNTWLDTGLASFGHTVGTAPRSAARRGNLGVQNC